MLPLFISSLAAAATVYYGSTRHPLSAYDAGWAIISFTATFFLVGFFVRKKSGKVQAGLQQIIDDGQTKVTRMVHQFQSKPTGNPANLQKKIEIQQQKMLKDALDYTKNFEPLKKWSLLMGRQIDTMRLQFYYQLKQFKEVDELLASRGLFRGPMLMEPMSVAMKMAREYKNDNIAAAEKTYARHSGGIGKKKKGLLYALMSWIHVKQGNIDKAREVLTKGKDVTGHEVFIRNWEHLSNDNVKKFSNAGFGEQWYALYLEKTPSPKLKQQRARGKGRF